MRWDCPHCGVLLTISEERAGLGWSFSRCSKCNGFALIRRAETHVIKVDRAPSGEKVLIADSSPSAQPVHAQNHLMSAAAHRRLGEITQTQTRRVATPPAPPIEARYRDFAPLGLPAGFAPTVTPPVGITPLPSQNAPQTTHEGPAASTRSAPRPFDVLKALPFAMGVFGTIAMGSGFYLFQQGQALTGRMNTERTEHRRNPSGSYTDQVRQTAMAPERPLASQVAAVAAPTLPPASTAAPVAATIAPSTVAMPTNDASSDEYETTVDDESENLAEGTSPGIPEMRQALKKIDQNQSRRLQSRMPAARLISREDSAQNVSGLVIKPRTPRVGVYAQPTLNSKIIAVLNPKEKYLVTEWSDRWFKVLVPPPPGGKVGARTSAWVRNDLVQLLSRQP